MTGDEQLLSALVAEGQLTPTARRLVERFAEEWSLSALRSVLMSELMTESDLANFSAHRLGLTRLYNLQSGVLAPGAARFVSFAEARRHLWLPLAREGGGTELVVADPWQPEAHQRLVASGQAQIALAVAERSDILKATFELYPLEDQLPSLAKISRGGAVGNP